MLQQKISKFTYGTLSLGKPMSDTTLDHELVEMAIDQDVYIHASRDFQEGRSYEILNTVFKNHRDKLPNCIIRLRADNPEILKDDVEHAFQKLYLKKIDVAQLYVEGEDKIKLVEDFERQGPIYTLCKNYIDANLIGDLALEVFSSYASVGIEAIKKKAFSNFVFYYNLLERQVDNELFTLIENTEGINIFALRPIGQIFSNPFVVNQLDRVTGSHAITYDPHEIERVYLKSGCHSKLELSIRFLLSQPKCLTIIGGTSSISHLDDFISFSNQMTPLEDNLINDIKELHRRWYK